MMLKKLLICLFIICCIFALAACDDGSNEQAFEKPDTDPHECTYSELVDTKDATCKEGGYSVYKCSCGETNTIYTATTECSYGDWQVTTAPTLGTAGSLTKT